MKVFQVTDFLGFLLVLGVILVVLSSKADSLDRNEEFIFLGLLTVILFHHFGHILEWSFNVTWINLLSNYVQILQPILFGFFLFSYARSIEITKLREAEKEIRELNRFREKIIEDAKTWIDVLDIEANVLVWNKAAEEISGYSKEEVVGYDKIWSWLYPDKEYREKVIEKVNGILRGEETKDYETTIRTKEGEEKTISWTSHPLRNEDGEIIGSIAIGRDVTQQKEAEKREKFLHSLFTHDLRNQAQVIMGYLKLIKEEIEDKEKEERIEKAIDSVESTLDLADKLRKTIRAKESVLREIKPHEFKRYIEEAINEKQDLAKEKEIEIRSEIKGIRVMAGPLIKDVLVNLLGNAIQHADCKKIKITTKENENKATITVEDDGVGLTDSEKELVFDKEYTKKPASGGLGLPLVKRILETYDGEIIAKDSELGGARFDVHLKKP